MFQQPGPAGCPDFGSLGHSMGEATPLIYKAHIHFDAAHLWGQSFCSWPFLPCQAPVPSDRLVEYFQMERNWERYWLLLC